MKSGKQRRAELQAKRDARRKKAATTDAAAKQRRRLRLDTTREADGVAVNPANLAPSNSYCTPDFVGRGYYLDQEFTCKDCGCPQVWTATQQKWWYEVGKGGVFATATRCRACRRRERERRDAARRVHQEGLARKKRAP